MNAGGHNVAIDPGFSGHDQVSEGLHDHLDATVFGDPQRVRWIRQQLRAGDLVVISDAFDRDFAQRVHAGLDASTSWCPTRRYDARQQFCREVIAGDDSVPELARLHAAMSSDRARRWIEDLSGRSCDGDTELEAQWLLPGHYANMTSGARRARSVAVFWHLSKDWDSRWGGDLNWHLSGSVIQPSFNTMYMFRVDPGRSPYSISPVIPAARGKRLSISCWWSTRQGPTACVEPRHGGAKTAIAPKKIDDEIFSLRSYHDVVD